MISSLSWVPRGAAAANPKVAPPSTEELAAMRELAEAQAAGVLGGADADAGDSSGAARAAAAAGRRAACWVAGGTARVRFCCCAPPPPRARASLSLSTAAAPR